MKNQIDWGNAIWYVVKVLGYTSGLAILSVLMLAAAFYWARGRDLPDGNYMDKDRDDR